MSESVPPTQLRDALAALRRVGELPLLVTTLGAAAESVRSALVTTIVDEVPAYSESGNPDILPGLEEHLATQVREVLRLIGGGATGAFDFVRDYARRHAEQKFPLEATLHAYRSGHRVLSRWLRDAIAQTVTAEVRQAIAAAADFTIEYTDTISTIATAEYVAETRRLSEAEGDRRTELLRVLLSGYDESDGRVARLLRRAGYLERRLAFCVAVAQPVDATEMDNPARAQRLSESLGESVRSTPFRSLVGVRDNVVVAVISDTRRLSGWTAPQTALAGRIKPFLLTVGPAALIGLSADAPSTSRISKALDQARMALDFASVGNRVVQFTDIPVRQLVLRGARDNVQAAMPGWIDDFLAADDRSRGALSGTLRAYADADMNVLKAAKVLSVHPNTIYARAERINDVTGMNILSYHALTELLLALDCRRY